MPTCKAPGQKSQLAEERLSPIRDKGWSVGPSVDLQRRDPEWSRDGRTDGVGLRKRPRSSSRKQPREAAKIQMKRGGRLSERASASRDWNEWLFWEFDGTVVSLSHCVLCCAVGGRRIFSIIRPRQARSICCRGTTARPRRPTTIPAKAATFVFVHSFGEVCLSKGISSGSLT